MKKVFLHRDRLRAGWRILIFLSISFPPLYYITSLLWTQLLIRYFIIFSLLLILSFIFARYVDKRPIATIGFMLHSRWFKEYALGVIIGFIAVSIILLIELILGHIDIRTNDLTIPLLVNIFIYSVPKTIFQSAFEELFFRGYIYQCLIEGTNAIIATALTSAIFGAGHLLVPHSSWVGALNITILGMLLAICYLRTRSLWLPSALHFSWNYSMRHICGLTVSGSQSTDSLLITSQQGPEWLVGGDFGPEEGLLALIVMASASFFIFYWRRIRIAPEMASLWDKYRR